MKLISCYIENFGGLSRYSLTLQPGITVIQEPNGFGKTTLAEFIRAMFYGFPRAGRSLEKNARKKYAPWQGGKYGGSLVFSHNGKTYRMDRSFGATPKSDTFSLFDAETMQRSTDFSENIGLELFGLDADSFERSTYLPQVHDNSSLTTDSIQSKLSDLVDDTNDINNYEKAIASLRAKRSAYIPYRGSGGSVAQAQRQISALQLELSVAGALRIQLQEASQRCVSLKHDIEIRENQRNTIRRQILHASQAAAASSLQAQYASMQTQQEQLHIQLEDLHRKYPRGLPGGDELAQTEPLFDEYPTLIQGLSPDPAVQEAQNTVREQEARFPEGLPSAEDLQTHLQECRACQDADLALQNTRLSSEEHRQLEELNTYFAAGVPDEEWMRQSRSQLEELNQLCSQQSAEKKLIPGPEKTLEAFFSAGCPDEELLQTQQEKLRKLTQLQEETSRLASGNLSRQEAPKKSSLPWILCSGSVLCLIFGVVMLLGSSYALGGIALGAGVLLLIGAVYGSLRQSLARATGGGGTANPLIQEKIEQNERQIRFLQQELTCFTAKFPTVSTSLPQQLAEIESNFRSLQAASRQRSEAEARSSSLSHQIDALARQLDERLQPYFDTSFEDTLAAIRLNREKLALLQQKQSALEEKRRQIRRELEQLTDKLSAFLIPLTGAADPADFPQLLHQLQLDCDRYRSARKIIEAWDIQAQQQRSRLACSAETLSRFCQRYALTLTPEDRSSFRQLQQDVLQHQALVQQYRQGQQACEDFRQKHAEALCIPHPEAGADPAQLRQDETELTKQLSALTEDLLQQEQQLRSLQQQVDALPEKEDALSDWIRQKQEQQHRCELLDKTISFLEQAKENLTGVYLGTLRERFCYYAGQLLNIPARQLIVTSELEVQMDCQGHPRELGYFSAGQADLLTLCMRLALVDALFRDTKPFLILDDPFINLDDGHMKQAARLLETLGQDHQILYLVCNSSRSLSEA